MNRYDKMCNIIYGYPLHHRYKYIIAHVAPMKKYKYNAMDSTNSYTDAIWLAEKYHRKDGLEWVVIENF